jgi:hypothetical protein
VAEAAPHVRQLGQRLLAQLDEAEREQLLGYLGRIGDQAGHDEQPGRAEQPGCA